MASRPANPAAAPDSEQATTVSSPSAVFRFPRSLTGTIEQCWRKTAVPADWNLKLEEFQKTLERSVARRFGDVLPNDAAVKAYLETLQLADLALACACGAGSPAAWDFFVAQFRPELYRAARAIAGDANARELADSLYADLYGLREFEGRRKSLFDYFHGRSKLGTWLRAVLAQRHVDEIRRTRNMESLEDDSGEERHEIAALASAASASPANAAPDPERAKYLAILQTTLTVALDALEPRDRLRLAYYYADDRTLAEIGRLLGEHEATVSRKLERTRRDVRRRVEAALRDGKKWSEAQLRLCFDYARGEWPFDLTAALQSRGSPEQQPDAELNPDARKI
jgi:RNA polymerase sigma-70 factor, ECF subfamily